MYTGIVQGTEKVKAIEPSAGYSTLQITNTQGFFNDVATGASVAVNGVCLTVTGFDGEHARFDVSRLTAETTTLQHLQADDVVNIERSCRAGSENGGHSLYGHVEGVARVERIIPDGLTQKLVISVPADKMKYFFDKGFIGLHGCSLTIHHADREKNTLTLNLIPETLRLTTLQYLKRGDLVNYEVEQSTRAIVETILNTLGAHTH